MVTKPSQPLKLFYCYAREDRILRDKLDSHLAALHRSGRIKAWYDGERSAGTPWEQTIKTHLDSADIILLLVSADFLRSDYCYNIEMACAIERHQANEARVIPVLLRQVDWEGTYFSLFQVLPSNAQFVTSWLNLDEAFENVAKGIRQVVDEIISQRTFASSSLVITTSIEQPSSSLLPHREEELESSGEQIEMSISSYLEKVNLDNSLAESDDEKEQLPSTNVAWQIATMPPNQPIPNHTLQGQSQDEQTTERIATRVLLVSGCLCILCGFALGQFFELLGTIIFSIGLLIGGSASFIEIAAFIQKKQRLWLVIIGCIAILDVILMALSTKDFASFIFGSIGSFVFFSSPVIYISTFDCCHTNS